MKKKTIFDMARPDVETFRRADKMPVALVVDNVRSLNNIGSLLRTSDGFAVAEVWLCGISAVEPGPEVHKTALGAEDSVDWRHCAGTLEALDALRRRGFTICCLEQVVDSIELQDYAVDTSARYAVVVGNEVDGVDPAVVDACDVCLEIPQLGTKHSLNVAVSAAVALWHFYERFLPVLRKK
ncbi:MAG: TrmH family RNA methyltransferase [Muribaculaceae bacterium]|nr:TrmH family RNA methyltransferase [Muribaculaceae bacterium]